MSFDLGWNLIPLIITVLACGVATFGAIFMLMLSDTISGPGRDLFSFFSGIGPIIFLYAVAALISAISWGVYWLLT